VGRPVCPSIRSKHRSRNVYATYQPHSKRLVIFSFLFLVGFCALSLLLLYNGADAMGQEYERGASTLSTFTPAGGSKGSRKGISWRNIMVLYFQFFLSFFLFFLFGGRTHKANYRGTAKAWLAGGVRIPSWMEFGRNCFFFLGDFGVFTVRLCIETGRFPFVYIVCRTFTTLE